MKKIVIDGFELHQEQIKQLIQELKSEGVKSEQDLERYFKKHQYKKDDSLRSHLLISPNPKRRNFAIPFDD